jgi:AbrB family looped-hinge helix DNA binding protein
MAWATPNRERRVLKAGHSSIAVTLPKPWAEAMNLRPGDLIVFDQNEDGTLYLKPAPPPGTVTAGVPYLVQSHAFDTPGVLERLVSGAYRVGYDAIEIRAEVPLTAERLEELQQAARRLLGVSVVAQDPNRVVLQNFVDPSKYELPQLVQRMKMILVALIEESEALLHGGRPKRSTSLAEETNRVLALLVRQLSLASRDWSLARRIGSPDARQLLEWRVVVHALEELGTLFGEVLRELQDGVGRPSVDDSPLAELLGQLKACLKRVVEDLMHPSLPDASESLTECVQLGATARASARKLKNSARKTGAYPAMIALGRGADSLAFLSRVALDRAVSSGTGTVLEPSA